MGPKSRIMITGAAGFIGAHLARTCVARGHAVHGIVRPSSDTSGLDDAVTLHRFDIRDETAFRACLEDVRPDVVFHLAGSPRRPYRADLEDMRAFLREDLDGLVTLLKLCVEARRPPRAIVRAGSLAEYGAAPVPYRETVREVPLTAYGAHLVAATHLVATLQPRLSFPVSTARLALVFGPGQSEDYLVPLLVSRCLAGEELFVHRPDDRRDLIYVDEAVAGLLRIGEVPASAGRIVNLCSGSAPSMRDVARMVAATTGADPRLVVFNENKTRTRSSDLRGSPVLAYELLGWRTRISAAEGLRRMVSFQRDHASADFATAVMTPPGRGVQHAGV
ncbi:NAD-dependent dehydratase [Aureimonas sp. SA4125]|uniref:NAD-dependent epimerase/dehydratase family protein n=1 Tax=Aureimonas sp. SA4125 TaxID=2826993 RepID=UPI001CC80F6C|nr:NAD(P)-dependent oxidoreductase [Aureimonas sp. SA4125]BDA82949.1 NAD-dependent dehydratase [Aureimonas sp. SA4125]